VNRCICGHDRDTHLQDSLGAECTNRYCACETWRPYTRTRKARTTRPTTSQPEPSRDPAVYDRLEPCPSQSARLRHLAKTETCKTCGVEGAP
jgi:hypothetical protein